MYKIRAKSEQIRQYIIDNIERFPDAIAKVTASHFSITRQAVNKHLHKLAQELILKETGNTRNKSYGLTTLIEWNSRYHITPELAEDLIWRNDIEPILGTMPNNILDIWHYGFTEMFNNALDHSDATEIAVEIKKTAASTELLILDNGLGIFKKIQSALNLLDERHAILELSKGKLTTDPKHHTGEGVFFTSRMFDSYDILSGGVYFTHKFGHPGDWIFERENFKKGTLVWMKLNNHTSRTAKKVFDQFSSGDDYQFNKTVVPVRLGQYGNDKLISRSQAKRLLARIELFKVVIFDFAGVDSIGQAFADEIFRVFSNAHPKIQLLFINAHTEVKRMIDRAKTASNDHL